MLFENAEMAAQPAATEKGRFMKFVPINLTQNDYFCHMCAPHFTLSISRFPKQKSDLAMSAKFVLFCEETVSCSLFPVKSFFH